MMERSLWNREKGYYEVGLDANSSPVVPNFNWFQFYPDVMVQVFPILREILAPDAERVKCLYRELIRYYPPSDVRTDMPHNACLLAQPLEWEM